MAKSNESTQWRASLHVIWHGRLDLIASFVGYYCHPTTRSLPSSSIIPHSIDFFILVVVDVYKSLATYIINPAVQIDVYSSSKYGSC